MNENIENITEELIMRYVEGNLDSSESEKFERILSHNEYLNNRVSILKSISEANPLQSPSRKVHKQILSDLNISNQSDISFIKRYIDSFMNLFEKRPLIMGSILSGVAALFLVIFLTYDSIASEEAENYKQFSDESEYPEEDLDKIDSDEHYDD